MTLQFNTKEELTAHYTSLRMKFRNPPEIVRPILRAVDSPPLISGRVGADSPVLDDSAPSLLDLEIRRRHELLDGCILSRARKLVVLPVLEEIGMGWKHLFNGTRKPDIVRKRWLVFRALRDDGMSLPQIGRACGNMDHSTVFHGLKGLEKSLSCS